MGLNTNAVFFKPEKAILPPDIAHAFGLKNPKLNRIETGRLPSFLTGIGIAKYKDVFVIIPPKHAYGIDFDTGENSAISNRLNALSEANETMYYGNFETAMSSWFYYQKNGEKIRLFVSENSDELRFDEGNPLPQEQALYKSIRTVEEGVEVYAWWNAEKNETQDFTRQQVGGSLANAVSSIFFEKSYLETDFSEVEFFEFIDFDAAENEANRRLRNGKQTRMLNISNQSIATHKLDDFIFKKILPLLEKEGYEYNVSKEVFAREINDFQQKIGLWRPESKGKVATRIFISISQSSRKYQVWLNNQNGYPSDAIPVERALFNSRYDQFEQKVEVKNAQNFVFTDDLLLRFTQEAVSDFALPFLEKTKTLEGILPHVQSFNRMNLLFALADKNYLEKVFIHDAQRSINQFRDFSFKDKTHFEIKFLGTSFGVKRSHDEAIGEVIKVARQKWSELYPDSALNFDLKLPADFNTTDFSSFDMSQKKPLVFEGKVKGTEPLLPKEPEAESKGFFGRISGLFKKKEKKPAEEMSFYRAALYARSNITLVRTLTKNENLRGIDDFIEKKLGHYPEFHEVDKQFYIISAISKAQPNYALSLFEKNTFEDLDVEQHFKEIQTNMDWMIELDSNHRQGKNVLGYIERLMGLVSYKKDAKLWQSYHHQFIRFVNQAIDFLPDNIDDQKALRFIQFKLVAQAAYGAAADYQKYSVFENQIKKEKTKLYNALRPLSSVSEMNELKASVAHLLEKEIPAALNMKPNAIKEYYDAIEGMDSADASRNHVQFEINKRKRARLRRELRSL